MTKAGCERAWGSHAGVTGGGRQEGAAGDGGVGDLQPPTGLTFSSAQFRAVQ